MFTCLDLSCDVGLVARAIVETLSEYTITDGTAIPNTLNNCLSQSG